MKHLSFKLFLLISLVLTSSCYNLDNELVDTKKKGDTLTNSGKTYDGTFKYNGTETQVNQASFSVVSSGTDNLYTFTLSNTEIQSKLNLNLTFPKTVEIDGTYSFSSDGDRKINNGTYEKDTILDIINSGTVEVTKISETKYRLKISCSTISGKNIEADITREFTKPQ